MSNPKPRTVHPSPPEQVLHGAAYWTGDDFEVREKDGVISVLPHGLDASFTVTRDDNYRLVGALVSALAWAEERGTAMTDTEPTIDLGAVRWSTENRHDGWHLVAIEDQPDGYGEVAYDLRVERATDTNGNDLSPVVAEAIARRLDGWNHDIDQAERDAYGRGFDAGRDVQDARWRVAAKDRDAEHRLNLEVALGWDLPEDPDDERDEPPTWAEIITAVKATRDPRAAVAPEVVAAAFAVTDPDEPIDGEGGWMPATSQLLRSLAEYGLKVVRA